MLQKESGLDRIVDQSVTKKPNFVDASGIRLITDEGKVYLDGVSGTFNLALGYNHPRVVRAIQSQVAKFSHISSSLKHDHVELLKQKLIEYAPKEITTGWFRDITGSTANECAIKIAQKYTRKTDVISFFMSHHGQTNMMTAFSGNAFRRKNFPEAVSPHSIKIPGPYHYQYANMKSADNGLSQIDQFIQYASSGNVACIILEPIMGNGGNIMPPPHYFQNISKYCKENNILIIADEVQTGIGRTGHMYASEVLGLEPDLIVLGKGLGGIGIPVAAVLMKNQYDILESFEHSFTSGANMLSIIAAITTLDVIKEEKLLENVQKNEGHLKESLEILQKKYPQICDVRGMGYMWGIEFRDSKGNEDSEIVNKIIDYAFKNHQLILRGSRYGFGNVLKVRPALIANSVDINEIIFKLDQSLEGVLSHEK
jgi:4-aminobutyrate aminotransferase-like enzyme